MRENEQQCQTRQGVYTVHARVPDKQAHNFCHQSNFVVVHETPRSNFLDNVTQSLSRDRDGVGVVDREGVGRLLSDRSEGGEERQPQVHKERKR
jgi:hypothetical protein